MQSDDERSMNGRRKHTIFPTLDQASQDPQGKEQAVNLFGVTLASFEPYTSIPFALTDTIFLGQGIPIIDLENSRPQAPARRVNHNIRPCTQTNLTDALLQLILLNYNITDDLEMALQLTMSTKVS